MEENSFRAAGKGSETKTLLLVYNADTGLFSVLTDYAHKILSPKTYPCNLCALTYGSMGMNNKWKEFIATLKVPIAFLHRDEFVKQHDLKDTQLPAAFLQQGESLKMLITNHEINRCASVEDLIDLVIKNVETIEWT